jgi:hypothetical protein
MEQTLIQITGVEEFENWRGYLAPMVGDTKAQGSTFAVFITPHPYTEAIARSLSSP